MTIFIPLVVMFMFTCVIIYLTSFLSTAFLVFFWVIVLLIKGFALLIPPPLSYILPAMLNLIKLTFLLSLAPRPNLFPLFKKVLPNNSHPIFQISWNHIFIILIHSPTTLLSHIPRSSSSPCDICYELVDESVQVDTSRAGSALPPSTSDPTFIEPTIDSSSLGSHPMITRAKAGIFETRHPANIGIFGSSRLLSALLASTEPKGFKYAAKNLAWVAAMDEEIRALQQNDTWTLVSRPANTNIVVSYGCFILNIFLMDPSSISRLVLLPKVILRFLVCQNYCNLLLDGISQVVKLFILIRSQPE